MNMRVNKGYYGWLAESEVELFDKKVLRVSTMKRSSGRLVTMAQAMEDNGNGMVSFIMFQDFNQTLETSSPKKVTEKAVREQQAKVMANIESAVAAAKAYYGKV